MARHVWQFVNILLTPALFPDNWRYMRDRWETFHAVRTFAAVGGLAFIVGGAMFG